MEAWTCMCDLVTVSSMQQVKVVQLEDSWQLMLSETANWLNPVAEDPQSETHVLHLFWSFKKNNLHP